MIRAIIYLSAVLLLAAGCDSDAGRDDREQGGNGSGNETESGTAAADTQETAATTDPARITELRARAEALREQVGRIEDANAIKRLQRAFGYYYDEGLWGEVVDLFAENAELEYARDGVYRGRDRIREYFMALGDGREGLAQGEMNEHFQLMPVITLAEDGQRAKGRWRDLILEGQYGEYAWWGEGPFENEYVKEEGVWKFARMHWFQTVMVPYEGGWAAHEDVNDGIWVSDELPPDEEMTIPYEPWPDTFLPPFHFDNPVRTAESRGEAQ